MTKPAIQILMVEDSQTDALLLEEMLGRDKLSSFEFTLSERLKTGLEVLQQQKFDLILLDLGLPDSQGLETFEKVHNEFPDVPVVVLSGLVDEKLALDAVQAGAQDYLVKGPSSWEIAPRAIRYAIERQQSQAALRESEEQYRLLFENAPMGILSVTTKGQITEVNTAALQILGSPSVEATKSINLLTFPPLIESGISTDFQSCIDYARPISAEHPYTTKWGKSIFVKYQLTPVLNTEGQIVLIQAIIEDTTEHKRAEEALKESEEKYRLLVENATIGIVIAQDRALKYINPRAMQLVDYSRDELLSLDFAERIHPDDRDETIGYYLKFMQGEETPTNHIFRVIDKAGGIKWIDSNAVLVNWEGQPASLNFLMEITGRKLAEQALYESEQRYRGLFEDSPVSIWEEDFSQVKTYLDSLKQQGVTDFRRYFSDHPEIVLECASMVRVLDVNNAGLRMYRAEKKEELIKQTQEELSLGEKENVSEALIAISEGRNSYGWEGKDETLTGEPIEVSLAWSVIPGHEEDFSKVIVTTFDITERKRAEEAIRLSEKKFKTLFEIAPVGISVLDQEQNIIDANYSLQRITGLSKKQLLEGTYRKRDYLQPNGTVMQRDELASARALKENMPIFDIETGIVTEDRGVIWTQVSAAPLDMPDANLVVITQDISERKQSEQALRQRLAELETLYESGLILSQITNPEKIANKLIALMIEKLAWRHVTIRRYHEEDGSLELLAFSHSDVLSDQKLNTIKERFQSMVSKSGEGLSGWVVQHGRTVRSGNLFQDSRYREVEPGLQSGLYVPMKIGNQIMGVISIESELPNAFSEADERLITTLAAQAAITLDNNKLVEDLQKSNDRLFQAYDDTIEGWSHALDLRDKETEGHTLRVTTLTEELAREMGIPDADTIHIRRGSLLHDIGKMGVPDRILLKPDKLSDDEWVIMREHPVYAYNLLSRIEFLRPALSIPYHHHEKWDGSGYPDGLKGEQIPLAARIFAIIDVFDALISDRPYRPAWSRDKAIHYIREQSGSHFDPNVVETFMKLIKTTTSA